MPRFFIDMVHGCRAVIDGEDGRHIARSLRMQPGDTLTLCNGAGTDYFCRISRIAGDTVELTVEQSAPSACEPNLFLTLYQGLPKSDKMDTIVQKAVELGASAVAPMMTCRSISRPDEKSARKKQERWAKIALEAAKQCGRGILPAVQTITHFETALKTALSEGPAFLFYEGGGEPLSKLLQEAPARLSLFIGPEGGFSPEEVHLAKTLGARFATLGPRILRTETAPLAAITGVMLLTGNMDQGGNAHVL